MSSSPKTNVVHIKDGYDVYVGRAGHGHDGYFGNPFRMGPWPCRACKRVHSTPSSTLDCYLHWFNQRVSKDASFRARLEELRGKRLGCFCRPKAGFQGRVLCHGQIIAAYLDRCLPSEVP
jgi:hypothetical protein